MNFRKSFRFHVNFLRCAIYQRAFCIYPVNVVVVIDVYVRERYPLQDVRCIQREPNSSKSNENQKKKERRRRRKKR